MEAKNTYCQLADVECIPLIIAYNRGKEAVIREVVEFMEKYKTPRRYSSRPFVEFRPPEEEWQAFLKERGIENG